MSADQPPFAGPKLGSMWLSVQLEADVKRTVATFMEAHPEMRRSHVALTLLHCFKSFLRGQVKRNGRTRTLNAVLAEDLASDGATVVRVPARRAKHK